MYVRKMREKFEEEERKAARLKPVPPSPVEMQVAVAIKVRDACRQLAANPETNRILEDELSGPDLSGTRDLIMHQGEEYRVAASMNVPGGQPCQILVAALAPKMLALSGTVADGTITWTDTGIAKMLTFRRAAPVRGPSQENKCLFSGISSDPRIYSQATAATAA